jgi:hypothetical protein
VCTVFPSVTPMRFYPEIKRTCQHDSHIKKQAERGNTFALHNTFYKIHFATTKTHLAMTELIHHLYNNNHQVLCPQRILKPRGSFLWHCKKLFLTTITYFTKENAPSLLINNILISLIPMQQPFNAH